MIGPFRQRSSWPSTGATALIGWTGFAIIVPLAFGYTGRLVPLAGAAVLAAAVQGAFLRLAFAPLRMERSLLVGAAWGAISGMAIVACATMFVPLLQEHRLLALLTGAYVGLAVGGFQTYFHNDDRKIEAEAVAVRRPVDYGRDAHWLDPFVYGAIVYGLALVPQSADAALAVGAIGMIVGVIAAGVSHFILSRWNNATGTIPLAMAVGAALGIPSGWLLRHHAAQLAWPPLLAGAIGGGLTFLVTATIGRRLSLRERPAVAEHGGS